MSNLLLILVVLFATLFVVVKLAERIGKPMAEGQQHKLSRIAMVLIAVLLVVQLLRQVF